MKIRLLSIEKYAIAAFLLLFLLTFADAELYKRYWVGGMVFVGLVWLVAILVAVASIAWAFNDENEPLMTLRAATAMPLAVAAALFTAPLATWSAGYVYLHFHERELAAARRAAATDAAVSITYIEGIPDGGVAIIDSPGRRPETLPQPEMLRLTGERIKGCRLLRSDYYLCGYD